MYRPVVCLAAALLFAPSGAPLMAWGAQGHALIAAGALKDLPPEVAAWFQGYETYLPDHANDPDRWKVSDPLEGPRHFLECEAYGGSGQVPRDEAQAKAQLGPELFGQSGQVPWTVLERVQRLTMAFKAFDRPQAALEASYLSHYVGDLNVPLHTTQNYDGMTTGQRGVHHRWETGLVERLTALPGWSLGVRPAQVGDGPEEAPWLWLQESFGAVERVLEDDRAATREDRLNRGRYQSQTYWTVFQRLEGPSVQEGLERSAQRTAEMILLAWTQAGKPSAKPAR